MSQICLFHTTETLQKLYEINRVKVFQYMIAGKEDDKNRNVRNNKFFKNAVNPQL